MTGQGIINTVGDYKVTFSPPIGRGTFGTVHKAEHKESKRIFAAKQLILTDDGVTNEYMQDMAERELAIIQGLQTHNNIVKSFDHFFNLGVFWIFLEFCDLKNLKGYLKDHPNLNLMSRLTIMFESASAVAFMHRQDPPVIHRDLKLENIMMKREGDEDVVKITDFGLSKLLEERLSRSVAFQQGQLMTTACGSQYFMAPEFSLEFEGGVRYDASVDTFALGLVFLVVIDNEPNKDFLPLSVEAKRAKQYVSIAEEMVAHSRGIHPCPTVVKTKESESPIIARIKRIIRNMTKFKARQRKGMQEVEEEFQEAIQSLKEETYMQHLLETERERNQALHNSLQRQLRTSKDQLQRIQRELDAERSITANGLPDNTQTTTKSRKAGMEPMGAISKTTTQIKEDLHTLGKPNINANPIARASSDDNRNSKKDTCVICLDDLRNPITLSKCEHIFCKECIDACFEQIKPKCPICGVVYGVLKGYQPENGTMEEHTHSHTLPSITFDFPDGIQEGNHPNPGKPYRGIKLITRFYMSFFLNEATKTVSLLKKAFDARVLFTIGRSSGSDQDDCVIPNGISLKGAMHLKDCQRVQKELAAMGIE